MEFNYEMFEEMVKFYLCDENAVITGSEVVTNALGSVVLKVEYTVSDEFAEDNELWYKDRVMSIILKRAKGDQGVSVSSCANIK